MAIINDSWKISTGSYNRFITYICNQLKWHYNGK